MTPPLPLGILAAARAVMASGWTPADLAGVVGWYDASVTHNGKTWTSTAAANIWEPGVYGWV